MYLSSALSVRYNAALYVVDALRVGSLCVISALWRFGSVISVPSIMRYGIVITIFLFPQQCHIAWPHHWPLHLVARAMKSILVCCSAVLSVTLCHGTVPSHDASLNMVWGGGGWVISVPTWYSGGCCFVSRRYKQETIFQSPPSGLK